MGFISTVTINNDFLHEVENYNRIYGRDLGKDLHDAVLKLSVEKPVSIHAGITAIESHHADYAEALLIGGRREGADLGICIPYHTESAEVSLLVQLADRHGFELHKKRGKKQR